MTETQNGPMAYRYGSNFDPNNLDTDRVVLLSFITDVSGSIEPWEDDFTRAVRTFIDKCKTKHFAEELMVQLVTFGSDVRFETGFQPVMGIDSSLITIKNRNSMTAGYDAVKQGLDSILSYGAVLEQSGTDVRYIVCLITDGDFNDGRDTNGASVRPILDEIRLDEGLHSKFCIFMYGVGNASMFEKTRDNLTIKPEALLTLGATDKDFEAMLTNVSNSVSASSSGTAVPTF